MDFFSFLEGRPDSVSFKIFFPSFFYLIFAKF